MGPHGGGSRARDIDGRRTYSGEGPITEEQGKSRAVEGTDLIVLLDVDNTLLDNDAVKRDLEQALSSSLHPEDATRFWRLYEEVRGDWGMISFPETLERFLPVHCNDPLAPQKTARALFELDFASHLRPGALELLAWTRRHATSVILSNGDQFFQRWKISKAGLAHAAEDRVWVFPEKELHFGDLDERFGSEVRFVLVEDKMPALLAARKHWGERVITVFVEFGHHAAEAEVTEEVDLVVGSPAQLLEHLLEVGLPSRQRPEASGRPTE